MVSLASMFRCVRDNVHATTQNFKWDVGGKAVVEPFAATAKRGRDQEVGIDASFKLM